MLGCIILSFLLENGGHIWYSFRSTVSLLYTNKYPGASQIGDAPDSAISEVDFEKIQDACFGNVAQLTAGQENAITAFGAASWLFISIIVIYRIFLSTMKNSRNVQPGFFDKHGLPFTSTQRNNICPWLFICAVTIFFILSHLWAFFRLRLLQSDMTEAAGGRFPDGEWTFGQIVAVIGFLPVCVEVFFQGRIERRAW
jgi:amino acid transporter